MTITGCRVAPSGQHWWWALWSTDNLGRLLGYVCDYCKDFSEHRT
jgi:hypothetical protein